MNGMAKCMFEGFINSDKCANALNDDGNPCSFCSVKQDDGEDSGTGICVDPEVAANMMQMNPMVSCTNVDSDTSPLQNIQEVQDYHDYKCTIKGFNDPEKCSHMYTEDKKHHCQYCEMDGPFGPQGICVSPEHAKEMKKLSPAVDCHTSADLIDATTLEEVEDESNPIKDCNLSGVDEDTCLDPSKVNGSECIWCDAKIGGFCFPKSWEEEAGHFLDCKSAGEKLGIQFDNSDGTAIM